MGSLVVRRASPIHGHGVFAKRDIGKGERIVEYRGERITSKQASERYDDEDDLSPHVLLFRVDARFIIDAGVNGNVGRFINHSCDPNAEAVITGGRIFFEALRPIAAGEEITYDYHLERCGRYGKKWESRYACRCAAADCRGTLLAPIQKRARPSLNGSNGNRAASQNGRARANQRRRSSPQRTSPASQPER